MGYRSARSGRNLYLVAQEAGGICPMGVVRWERPDSTEAMTGKAVFPSARRMGYRYGKHETRGVAETAGNIRSPLVIRREG